jgi:formate hydrogenlyase transcriptional activator
MEYMSEASEAWERFLGYQSSSNTTALLHKLCEAPNIGFAVFDEDLRYVFVNDALAKMNGLPAEAHLGKTAHDVLGDAAEEVVAWLRHVFSSGQPVSFEVTAQLPTRTKSGRWVVSYFPIKDSQDKVHQVGGVVVELPVSKESQERLADTFHEGKHRAEALLDLSMSLMSMLDAEELLPVISDFVRAVLPYEFASIALYDESVRRLRVHTLDSRLGLERGGDDSIVPATEAPFGPTFLHGEVRLHNRDSLLASDAPFLGQLLQAGIQSVCFLPLITRKGTLGTLILGRQEDNAFSPQDITFLKRVAAQVALALDNASAYREIRQLTEKLNKEKLHLQDEVRSGHHFEDIIGESPALHRVLGQVHTVAPSDATVLVLGETGTGKELVARAIHRLSSRKEANFIKLNCAAIPTGLLESELFGHEKGAFTGAISQKIGRLELADKGTLFLDEVGEIPLELQPKLLRVLQDQEFERLGSTRTLKVDIRLIAATNRDLAKSVDLREFRSDLFYRLHVFPVRLPPLRERGKDIPLLVRYFVQKFAKRMNKRIEAIPAEALRAFQSWVWPGNVRELENFIERSVILTQGTTLSVPLAELQAEQNVPHDTTLQSLERTHIVRVLRETGGVIAGMHGAAARLGMKRTTLQSRMQKLGISREEYQN